MVLYCGVCYSVVPCVMSMDFFRFTISDLCCIECLLGCCCCCCVCSSAGQDVDQLTKCGSASMEPSAEGKEVSGEMCHVYSFQVIVQPTYHRKMPFPRTFSLPCY